MLKTLQGALILIAIILGIILIIWLYFKLKPYVIRHDTTITINGGLGSGKTLTSVKLGKDLLKKNRFYKYKLYNFLQVKIGNKIRLLINKTIKKKNPLKLAEKRKRPLIYSNMPICYTFGTFKKHKEWAEQLTMEHLLLYKPIIEYSVVIIDEFPQFVDQFMWDEKIVQHNLNEFITFFRHYIGGYLIINAQSVQEIECHFRRKLNQSIQCFNFKKHLFGLFYTIRMCDVMINDQVTTMTNTDIEQNSKLHFGLFPKKGTYDSRCYSIRYKNALLETKPHYKWETLKTYQVLRLKEYISPLDIETTQEQKEQMHQECLKLMRKENIDNGKKRK